MKIIFYCADKSREHMLAEALKLGAKVHGDTFEIRRTADYGEALEGPERRYPGPTPDTDVACCFGVKGRSREIVESHRGMGLATLMFDKGYTRSKGEGGHTEYSRVSVNAPDPTAYMMNVPRKPDRWERLKVTPREYSPNPGGHILICSSSEKYHDFHRLPPPNEWAVGLVSQIKKMCGNQIIYRPKPSTTQNQMGVVDTDDPEELKAALAHYHAVLIRNKSVSGAAFSNGSSKMGDALRGAHCVVTHGSAAGMDAIIQGVPVVALGRSIALPVAEKELEKIAKPFWPGDAGRIVWGRALAYCQWTTAELRSGEAWADLRAEIVRQKSEKKGKAA